ncbi:MAG: hypothetical protein L0Z62_46730, partial [Gemmataceae bacterium]|nr:hypothetical protein [Gemmataceae bacterium]
ALRVGHGTLLVTIAESTERGSSNPKSAIPNPQSRVPLHRAVVTGAAAPDGVLHIDLGGLRVLSLVPVAHPPLTDLG